jgi:hypothetical protein
MGDLGEVILIHSLSFAVVGSHRESIEGEKGIGHFLGEDRKDMRKDGNNLLTFFKRYRII